MKLNNFNLLLLLSAALSFYGCSKDDSPFSGGDNHISSFQLKQGDVILNAAVSDGSIVLTAPGNLSLTGASVAVTISENASVEPDPSSISNWDDEQTFTVTAYNGTKKLYKYSVQRNVISKDGDIKLLNQADVEALAALKLSHINGTLTIGEATGTDSVYTLAPLSTLKSVKYGVIINATYAAKDVAGLENLEFTGALQIVKNNHLRQVNFPKLVSVMSDFVVNQSLIHTLDCPELVNIDKGLNITTADSLVSMNFPKLKTIVENLTITGGYSTNKLQAANFPALEKIGGNISMSNWKEATSMDLSSLNSVVSLSISSLPKLISISAPKLKTVSGNFSVSSNTLMTSMDFSSLLSISGDCQVSYNKSLEDLDGMKALSSVGGELSMSDLAKLKDIQGLIALKSVGKRVYLSNWPALEDETFNGLSKLNSVGGELIISQIPFKKFAGFALSKVSNLNIFGNGITCIEEIDIQNLEIETQLSINNITTPFVLKGQDVCNYKLTISDCNLNIKGFKEIGSFTYTMSKNQQSAQTAPIQKVTGDLTINIYNFDSFVMPDLGEVGGKFSLAISSAMKTVRFPKLKKSGETTLNVASLPIFTLPALQTVDGNCTITSGAYNADNLSDIQMPSLEVINGIFNISGYSSHYGNSKLTNLDGFAALKNAKGVTVSYNSGLADFKGLKNIITSFGASDWKVSNNSYNPTYQDMIEGKYVTTR